MNLNFIFFVGVFANLLLATIFPFQLLPQSTAEELGGVDYFGEQNVYFGENQKDATSGVNTILRDQTQTQSLLSTSTQESNFLESVSFFDGLLDGLTKIGQYMALLLPFSSIIFLLPGAIGFIFGGVYMLLFALAIVNFIRRG